MAAVADNCGKWTGEPDSEFDEQYAKFDAVRPGDEEGL